MRNKKIDRVTAKTICSCLKAIDNRFRWFNEREMVDYFEGLTYGEVEAMFKDRVLPREQNNKLDEKEMIVKLNKLIK